MRKLMILAAFCAALATGCSKGERQADAAAEPEAEMASAVNESASEHVRLYAFDCGHIEMNDLSYFTQGDEYDGRTNSSTVMCFLIRHPKGDLMWDSGIPQAIHDMEDGLVSGPFALSMPMRIESQLDEIGVGVGDVEYFSLSHSHFDHAGNGDLFAGSIFLIDKDERAHMFRDEARADADSFAAYDDLERAETIEFDGDYDVFGDGTVTILDMPGHTPGHKALLVQLDNAGPVLLSGDLYHLQESREKRLVPKFNYNVEDTLASMDRFEQIAKDTGARVVIQHVTTDYENLPRLPGYLD